jgi:site-specific DNA recombinase
MRAAIYARRSTEEHQEASLEIQISEAKRYIEKRGWTLDEAHIYVDDAVSRAEFQKRRGLPKMLNAAEKKAFDILVVRDETRLGGDMLRTSLLVQGLVDAGIRLFYHFRDEEVLMDGPNDRVMCALRNYASELERLKISERTREHLENKARRGLVVGGKIYGYDNVGVFEGDRRVRVEYKVNPEQAAIIKEVFTRYAAGESLKAIAKDLNARGVPSPRGKGWAQSALLPMIRNERYRGILTWGQTAKGYRGGTKIRRNQPEASWTVVESPELRIIDDDLWQAVQARMAAKTKYGRQSPRGSVAKYLLSGFSRCGVCGGRLQVINGKSSYDPVKVYICANYREKSTCTNSLRRPVKDVDAAVLSFIEREILTEDVITSVLKEVRRRLSERASQAEPQRLELEAQAKKLKGEIVKLGEALLLSAGDGMTSVVRMLSEREKSLSTIEARLTSMATAPQVLDLEVRRLEKEARRRLGELQGLTERRPEEARRALEALLQRPLTFTPMETPEGARFHVEGQIGLSSSIEGVPSGIRTRVTALKGLGPGPG